MSAGIKWSAFTAGSTLTGADQFVGLESGVNVRWTITQLTTFLSTATLAAGTITTSQPMTLTQTWNAGGVTFTAIKANVTDTTSAAASLLMDLQVGSLSMSSIDKSGTGLFVAGLGTAAGWVSYNTAAAARASTAALRDYGIVAGGAAFNSGQAVSWSSTAAGGGDVLSNKDSFLFRNSAGILGVGASATVGTEGIVPGMRFATTQVVTSLLNNNTNPQNVFASANDVLTLAASTTYFFEALYYINTGATTHTTATGFVASSAFTNISYFAELWSTTAGSISTTAPSVLDVTASTATVLNATSTATRTTIRCRGIIRTNGATTVTPQITFSAGPTGTCEVAVNSYFCIWPVGSNTVAAVGNWA